MIRTWWRRRKARKLPAGEICRTCLEEPTVADCWVTVEHYENLPEMGSVGGTLGRCFWCTAHKPDDAVPFRP